MKNDLIFDFGMHLGEDTDFYLKKGYRVVAVEANPDNVKYCTARFETEISKGMLHIISGAIVSDCSRGFITFYRNEKSNWGTVEKDWANRNLKLGKPSVEIVVPVVDTLALFSQHGVPHYIKLDLQGQELAALSLLKSLPSIPYYASLNLGVWNSQIINEVLSVSSSPSISEKVGFDKLFHVLDTFIELGYKKFKVVQQATIPGSRIQTQDLNGAGFDYIFERHSSGAFGNDATGEWLSYRQAVERYIEQSSYRGWFDIHATV